MSFYTALTGLNGAQADISATSNNIANVGTTGFKRSRAEFGDIFATSPLQNSSSSIGSGTILKGVKQQFTQGNIASSLNALDMAISGQGFFTLKPSLTSTQVVYTRNGSFNVDNNRNVVDSAGQFLLTYPVNEDGSVTAKDLDSAVPLQLPVTSGDPRATSNIDLAVNLPADADVVTDREIFADGYRFDQNDPNTYTNSTSLTIFDDLGNPTIATVYFIKTQTATSDDPTNKFDTRLVINDTIIQPGLVPSVDDSGRQIFIDRFGNKTTEVPDDNYFLEGKGSPLYKLDDQADRIPSQPAMLTGAQGGFDFGEEGNKLVEIVNDPMQFKATREAGNLNSNIYWGKDFLVVNVDDGDVPVSIDLRPGKYNAEQLAAEVERAINEAYGDDRKLQVRKNVDDTLTIDLFNLNPVDGTLTGLTDPIEVDLLQPSFVSEQIEALDITGSSPDFTTEEFLAHAQARINDALTKAAVTTAEDGSETINDGLGVSNQMFARGIGLPLAGVFEDTQVISFDHTTANVADDGSITANAAEERYLVHSFYGKRPTLSVYEAKTDIPLANNAISYNSSANALSIKVNDLSAFEPNQKIRLAGAFPGNSEILNGRELTIFSVAADASGDGGTIRIDTTGQGFPEDDFALDMTSSAAMVLHEESEQIEAFFEGADVSALGGTNNFNSKRIVLRETRAATHGYTNSDVLDATADATQRGIFSNLDEMITLNDANNMPRDTLEELGFEASDDSSSFDIVTTWVDELDPPVRVGYDSLNQTFTFSVNHRAIGPGTDSNFRAFRIYGDPSADDTNNLGIPSSESARQVAISSTSSIRTEPFVADGQEMQTNANRFGVEVRYNSDTKTFTFKSGTTGENIAANGALGVEGDQKASNIQVGRYAISTDDGSVVNATFDTTTRALGTGENGLMGVGANKDVLFEAGRGRASEPARAVGATAKESLNEIFNLSEVNGETTFNVSVNGINGVLKIPSGNYVGSTLAEELQTRINQIIDNETGQTVGGVSVRYNPESNNFVFTTGTTGESSTIKIKGAARLGLDDVPLGVGSVPEIVNLVQATNEDGIPLYVDADGNVVETPPERMVTDYYPLYLDEGELTFDKTGRLISPLNNIRFEQQAEGFSISLDMDFSGSTQLATPFAVNNLNQDGFTSGRLDGLDIDSTGLIRANYTNGQNKPLGKIVLANFNNQNGLKQIGNATYVETATSGAPNIGEAGTEGFGSIQSGSLERSNVDITEELVNLITAQRNFQASSKAIETSTQLTQTIINIRT